MSVSAILLLIFASLVLLALASYAAFLMFKLRSQTLNTKLIEADHKQKQIIRDLKAVDSIVLITKAISEKQCEISEGCWRLSVLMESLPQYSEELKSKFPAIFKLYSQISHMPILDARKQLSKKDRLALDLERMGIEQELEPAVYTDVADLLPYVKSLQKELNQQKK
ncbi:DUF2489 domain-containing protein [Thalassotalea psychrophila]|uniref:DUF2489 domain-containing protein n=1 Tax=Thalassotalea psychrophila TaxID=3065647 RepID=A0ABY9TUA9_9GAMM|nr:DUF2489 domain-containing protein [Colwelliaceae bacterium SQ149]